MSKKKSIEEAAVVIADAVAGVFDRMAGYLDQLAEKDDEVGREPAEPKETGSGLIVDPNLPVADDRVKLRMTYPAMSDETSGPGRAVLVNRGVCRIAFDSGVTRDIAMRYVIKDGPSAETPNTVDFALDNDLSLGAGYPTPEEKDEALREQLAEDNEALREELAGDEDALREHYEERTATAEKAARDVAQRHSLLVKQLAIALGVEPSDSFSEGELLVRAKDQRSKLQALLKRLGAVNDTQIRTAIEALESLQATAISSAQENDRLQREINSLRKSNQNS